MYINDFLDLNKVKTHYYHLIWMLDWEIISLVWHKYKKTNNYYFLNIEKATHLCKANTFTFSRMQKTHQNHGH